MHFKTLGTKKPGEKTDGERFIPNPEAVYKNLKPVDKDSKGFWADMQREPWSASLTFRSECSTIRIRLRRIAEVRRYQSRKEAAELYAERNSHRPLREAPHGIRIQTLPFPMHG
jgi:hypothetical protein